MDAMQALWSDVERDLRAAAENASAAASRAESLQKHDVELPPDLREDLEIAIGARLHNCYGALEEALERLIRAIDGQMPTGAAYHTELVKRAADTIDGVRPALISRQTASLLHRLRGFRHVFRHAYDDYDYSRAEENVEIAERAVAAVKADLDTFAAKFTTSQPS